MNNRLMTIAAAGLMTLVTLGGTGPLTAQRKKARMPSAEQIAWKFGTDLTTMALMHANGMEREDREKYLKRCNVFARYFGVAVPKLPRRTGDKIEDNAHALGYVLRRCFKPIAREIERKKGKAVARLFEVALKGNLLLTTYYPGSKEGVTMVRVLKDRLRGTGVPVAMVEPIAKLVRDEAPRKQVMKAVFAFRNAVAKKLAARASRAPGLAARRS